jgi:protein involved in polysaccharide export with SLBB domain
MRACAFHLIAKADGLKEDAYSKRARIIRVKSDLTTEIVNVSLDKALGDLESDIALNKEDVVTVYSILDFVKNLTIDGEIKTGVYDYYEGLTLNDLFVQAGGLTGSASKGWKWPYCLTILMIPIQIKSNCLILKSR